jgi:hypothetical protein
MGKRRIIKYYEAVIMNQLIGTSVGIRTLELSNTIQELYHFVIQLDRVNASEIERIPTEPFISNMYVCWIEVLMALQPRRCYRSYIGLENQMPKWAYLHSIAWFKLGIRTFSPSLESKDLVLWFPCSTRIHT